MEERTSLPRQRRRALEREEANRTRAAPNHPAEPRYNGIQFHQLTKRAYVNVVDRLYRYENELTERHCDGLLFQAGLFTLKAQNKLSGRHQVTLAPGVGKTEGIVSWLQALVESGHDHIGVAVAASKVEELCNIKRSLLAAGVPARKVGLWHEYKHDPEVAAAFVRREIDQLPKGKASEPSEGHGRQILLITHARIMTSPEPDTYRLYQGRPRMVVYDEALVKSKAMSVPLKRIKGAISSVEDQIKSGSDLDAKEALAYLEHVRDVALAADEKLDQAGQGQILDLPHITLEAIERFSDALPNDAWTEPLKTVLEISANDLKVVKQVNGLGGLVTYDIVIPRVLDNVAILDASYPVRDLVKRDHEIIPGERSKDLRLAFADVLDIASMDLSKIKRYDNVEVRQMRVHGGRTTMEEHFNVSRREARREDNKVCQEITDVISSIPGDQAILIFTFKDRENSKSRFSQTIQDHLEDAGIDLKAEVEERPRINILTWGQETAINDYAHCRHVILAGVIRRDRLELEGAILGQVDKLDTQVTSQEVSQADLGEVLHSIYQALNRGTCRNTINGQAAPMTGWIMHRNTNIQEPLSRIMPGIRWGRWKPNHFTEDEAKEGAIEKATQAIVDYLAPSETRNAPIERSPYGDSAGFAKISFRQLRKNLNMANGQSQAVADRTWTVARQSADERLQGIWRIEGASYVRVSAEFYGFTSE